MAPLTDVAIAQAFREFKDAHHPSSAAGALFRAIEAQAAKIDRARELDATVQVASNPAPTLSKEAVEMVGRAIYECEAIDSLGDFPWNYLVESGAFPDTTEKYRRMARAAIAAMQASGGGK